MTGLRLPPAGRNSLAWPRETALQPPPSALLLAAGSNVVLDVHGDPTRARLAVLSDGNHHMALADVMAAFVRHEPAVGDVFYATTPPRILIDILKTGRITLGNLVISVSPGVFISPVEVLSALHRDGGVGPPEIFASSRGTAILVRKGNPRAVTGLEDLVRPDVRLAISNPETEQASFAVYASAITAACTGPGLSESDIAARLRSDRVIKSRVIHHREIPEILAAGEADASLVYRHLALRYVRAFPELFEMLEGSGGPITAYAVALVGDGGAFGASFVRFLHGPAAQGHYERHGLQTAHRTE